MPAYLNPTLRRNVPQSWYTRNSSSHRQHLVWPRPVPEPLLLDTDSYNRTAREQLFGEPVEIRAAATAARARPRACDSRGSAGVGSGSRIQRAGAPCLRLAWLAASLDQPSVVRTERSRVWAAAARAIWTEMKQAMSGATSSMALRLLRSVNAAFGSACAASNPGRSSAESDRRLHPSRDRRRDPRGRRRGSSYLTPRPKERAARDSARHEGDRPAPGMLPNRQRHLRSSSRL